MMQLAGFFIERFDVLHGQMLKMNRRRCQVPRVRLALKLAFTISESGKARLSMVSSRRGAENIVPHCFSGYAERFHTALLNYRPKKSG